MRSHLLARHHVRWYALLLAVTLIFSIALGGSGISAGDPATATPNYGAGSLNPPPPTNTPTPTTAPPATNTPTAPPPTTTPTPATTPTGTTVAPAVSTSSPTASPSATASGTPASGAPATTTTRDNVDYQEIPEGGGSYNVVRVQNKTDNRLRLKAKIQLNHIPGNNVQPVNYAEAIGSCTNCQTFAVALQIDLRSRTASVVAPKNAAVALNIKCTNCHTVADAYQYVVPVDDPTQTPDNVKELIKRMQHEFEVIAETPNMTAAEAEARVNGVIQQFIDLAQSLYQQHEQTSNNDTPGATVPPDTVVLTPPPTATMPPGTPTTTAVP